MNLCQLNTFFLTCTEFTSYKIHILVLHFPKNFVIKGHKNPFQHTVYPSGPNFSTGIACLNAGMGEIPTIHVRRVDSIYLQSLIEFHLHRHSFFVIKERTNQFFFIASEVILAFPILQYFFSNFFYMFLDTNIFFQSVF